MKLIQLAQGFRGARQIAGARAEAALRKLGHTPPITYRTNGRDRGWTDEEYDEAIVMRLAGLSDNDIATRTGRTAIAISRQLGPRSRA